MMAPVAGVRNIWQDEAETAERARSIVATGLPHILDPEGRVSVNAGGREIEEGTLHRYTPWGQFYVGASGLAIGRTFGLSDDTSIRLPFVFLHAASSSVLSVALATVCGWPVVATAGISTLFGLQTVRILNNRSARYHAALDFLLLLALLGIALKSRVGNGLLSVSLFLLPQMHTLGGAILASTVVLFLFADALFETRSVIESLAREFWRSMVPALASVVVILVLCRPWLQSAWMASIPGRTRFSLNSTLEISYSFYLFAGWMIFLLWKKQWKSFAVLALVTAYIVGAVAILESNPFNQPRYYLSVPIFFLFWPFITGSLPILEKRRTWVIAVFGLSVLMSDLQGIVPYFEGVRIVLNDYRMKREEQPLTLALSQIPKGAPVLADYVPQFVNWYLRSNGVALMPRDIEVTKLNNSNPIFAQKRVEPEWHVYFEKQDGLWPCYPNCDYHRKPVGADTYDLVVDADRVNLAETIRFCIVRKWEADHWNNAPFSAYNPDAFEPEGPHNDTLVLARKCSK